MGYTPKWWFKYIWMRHMMIIGTRDASFSDKAYHWCYRVLGYHWNIWGIPPITRGGKRPGAPSRGWSSSPLRIVFPWFLSWFDACYDCHTSRNPVVTIFWIYPLQEKRVRGFRVFFFYHNVYHDSIVIQTIQARSYHVVAVLNFQMGVSIVMEVPQ